MPEWPIVTMPDSAAAPQLVCVDCGCRFGAPGHHLTCDCGTCDVPADARGLEAEMRRRARRSVSVPLTC